MFQRMWRLLPRRLDRPGGTLNIDTCSCSPRFPSKQTHAEDLQQLIQRDLRLELRSHAVCMSYAEQAPICWSRVGDIDFVFRLLLRLLLPPLPLLLLLLLLLL